MTGIVVFAAVGWKALLLLYIWLLSAIVAAELSRSKGYGEKPGLGTGLLLTALGPVIWLLVPPKDETAEWHERKPWQRRRRPKESEMADMGERQGLGEHGTDTSASQAGTGDDPGAGSRGGASRA